MTTPDTPPKHRIGLIIWLIVSQLLAVGSLVIWAYLAGISVMAFDEGGSPIAWAIVITVWAYPILPLLLAVGAWVSFGFRKNKLAAVLTGLTFTPPVLFVIFMWISNIFWAMTRYLSLPVSR